MAQITDESFNTLIRGRRDFLHNLSNKITVTEGMILTVIRSLPERKLDDETMSQKLEKATNAVHAMIDMLKAEREILVKLGNNIDSLDELLKD